ncbi:MAG: hypothetical protein HY812_00360 [Planctomycetes bacterium]|nr:hypothetical protein [Planctomycetota bacterium]
MRRAAALLLLLACAACAVPAEPPLEREGIVQATREALEATLRGEPLDLRLRPRLKEVRRCDEIAAYPSGMAGRLELLNAVNWRERATWLDLMLRVQDGASDPFLERTATQLLEQDEAYFAAEMEGNRIYSGFAGFFNGVMRMGFSALTGNPVGVIRPILEGVDVLLGVGSLEALDRKQVEMYRQWLAKHPDGEGLSPDPEAIRRRVAAVDAETFAEEVLLTTKLADEGKLDAAAAHLHVAQTRRREAPEVAALGQRLEQEFTRRRERLARAVGAEPLEMELVRGAPELNERYAALVEAILLEGGQAPFEEAAALAARAGRGDVATCARNAARLVVRSVDLEAAVRRAKSEHVERRRRFLFTGFRPDDDPLKRYQIAQEESRRSLADVLEPIFWIPATLIRVVYSAFADPIDDRPVVDALAALAWRIPPGPRRDEVLADLADRYEERGETQKALAVARLLPAAGQRIARLEEDLAQDVLRRSGSQEPLARRQALELILERFPKTEAAAAARAELDDLLTDEYAGAAMIPGTALLPLAAELGIDPRLLDGREENGEMSRGGAHYLAERLLFEVERGKERERLAIAVGEGLKPRMDALAAEWEWRRRASRTATYRELHEGVPVELSAGIGSGGIGVYPRLLPEEYRGEDRALFE